MDKPDPLLVDLKTLIYFLVVIALGGLSAFASLLGSNRMLSWRTVLSYLIAGGVCSLGVVLLVVEWYGFSYSLTGLSIFAGYKAFDVLALVSAKVSGLTAKTLDKDSNIIKEQQ